MEIDNVTRCGVLVVWVGISRVRRSPPVLSGVEKPTLVRWTDQDFWSDQLIAQEQELTKGIAGLAGLLCASITPGDKPRIDVFMVSSPELNGLADLAPVIDATRAL